MSPTTAIRRVEAPIQKDSVSMDGVSAHYAAMQFFSAGPVRKYNRMDDEVSRHERKPAATDPQLVAVVAHTLRKSRYRSERALAPIKIQITLRIVVLEPPTGAVFAMQQGRTDLLPPVKTSAGALVFEFPVSVADAASQPPRFTGEFAQGPPNGRFVYVNSGTMAGQTNTCWTRRAKVPLTGISHTLLNSALIGDGRILEARIVGKARDGGPACATVPLLAGWALVDRT